MPTLVSQLINIAFGDQLFIKLNVFVMDEALHIVTLKGSMNLDAALNSKLESEHNSSLVRLFLRTPDRPAYRHYRIQREAVATMTRAVAATPRSNRTTKSV